MMKYGFDVDSTNSNDLELYSHALQKILAYFPGDEDSCALIEDAAQQAAEGKMSDSQRLQLLERIYPAIKSHVMTRQLALLAKKSGVVDKYKKSHDTRILQQQLAVAYISLFSDEALASLAPLPASMRLTLCANEAGTDAEVAPETVPAEATEVTTETEKQAATETETDVPQDDNRHRLGLAMHRALEILVSLLKWHYQMYCFIPMGLWQNIHYVYVHACGYSLQGFTPLTETTTDGTVLTIAALYKRALLLSAADTYGMQSAQIDAVFDLLLTWGEFALLRDSANRADLYSVDLTSGRGAGYQSLVLKQEQEYQHWLSLDTTELGLELGRLYALAGESLDQTLYLDNKKISQSLLYGLMRSFMGKPERKYSRVKDVAQQKPVYMRCIDPNVMKYIAQPEEWTMLDTSAKGYCLTRRDGSSNVLSVGQILWVEQHGEGNLAIIRWLTYSAEYDVRIGVELLASSFQRLEVRFGRKTVPILLLPEIKVVKQPASIVIASGFCEADGELELPQGKAALQRCLHHGSQFSQYAFAYVPEA